MLNVLRWLFALFVFPGFAFLLCCSFALEWLDRVIVARLQGRIGPPWYQPVADLIKLFAKEDILPVGAHPAACALLPMVSLAAVLTAGLLVPVASPAPSAFEGDLIVVVFLLSISSLAYFLAGWLSVSVYSVLGGNRSLLQYFSYEVPLLMALIGPSILSGSWSIAAIVQQQQGATWMAFVQPVGFLVAIVGLIGKLKRSPLDIPKAKSEISAGSLTEFSGRKLALWHLSMHMTTVVGIFLLVNLFMGGGGGWLPAPVGFAAKTLLVLVLLSVIEVLYARLRIDQLADIGWKLLAPLALAQLAVTVLMGG